MNAVVERFNPTEYVHALAAQAWRPRTDGIVGRLDSYGISGECLEPLMRAGDTVLVEETSDVRPGDVVLFEWAPWVLEDHERRTGECANPVALKIFDDVLGQPSLIAREGYYDMNVCRRILGVVRRLTRRGARGRPLPEAGSTLIAPNAATVVASATDLGPLNFTLNPPATSISQNVKLIDLTGVIDVLATVELSGSFRLGITGSGFIVKTYFSHYNGTTTVRRQIGERTTNLYANESGVSTFILTDLDTSYFNLEVDIFGNGMDTVTAIFQDLQMRATVVKR